MTVIAEQGATRVDAAVVDAAIEDVIEKQGDTGAQVAAYLNGQLVIDTWGGQADPATRRRSTERPCSARSP
jgi:hypothetical protein